MRPLQPVSPKQGVAEENDNNTKKKFWEELIAYFPSIRHHLHIKRKNHRDTKAHRQVTIGKTLANAD
jgi:hypothetical protein